MKPHPRTLRRWSSRIGALLLLGGILAILLPFLRRYGGQVWALLRQTDLRFLVPAFLSYSLALLLAVWVWREMVLHLGGPRSFRFHLGAYATTNLGKRLPGSLWFVLGRSWLYARQGVRGRAIAFLSGLEYGLILLSAAGVGLLTLPLLPLSRREVLGIVGTALLLLPLFHRRVLRFFLGLFDPEHPFPPSTRQLLRWGMGYAGVWGLGSLTLFFLARALQPLPPAYLGPFLAAWALSGLAGGLIVLLPSGLGVREVSLGFLLLPFLGPAPAAAVALLSRAALTLFEAIWALLGLLCLWGPGGYPGRGMAVRPSPSVDWGQEARIQRKEEAG